MDNEIPNFKCDCFHKLYGYNSLEEVKQFSDLKGDGEIWKRDKYLQRLIFDYSSIDFEEKVQLYAIVRFVRKRLLEFTMDLGNLYDSIHSFQKLITARKKLAVLISNLQSSE